MANVGELAIVIFGVIVGTKFFMRWADRRAERKAK
jgi:hypothetical protein